VAGSHACTVSFEDAEGVQHAVEVSASTLYEAVALALAEFRRVQLAECAPGPMTELSVTVKPPMETHRVRVRQFHQWLECNGKTPAEQALKARLREVLGRGRQS
jgi:hypothetical protein